jgi:hypothetical protein
MAVYNFDRTLSKGTEYSLSQTPIENGKIRLTTDTKKLFFDVNDSRFELTDFISNYTEEEIKNISISNVTSKFYLAKDNFKLYKFINGNWQAICDSISHADSADTATYADRTYNDSEGNLLQNTYAKLNSPSLTGTPTTPNLDGSINNQITNVKYVKDYVSEQLQSLRNGMIVIANSLDDLPIPGSQGYIYLVPTSRSSDTNRYDEYIWSTTLNEYEKFGTTDLDLSQYVNDIELAGSGNAITNASKSGNKITYTKGSTFLTEHPNISTQSSSSTEDPLYGVQFDVVDSLSLDSNGHVTGYNFKKVRMPSNVDHANSADNATNASNVNWNNVNGRPTKVSAFENDANYLKNTDSISNADTAQIAINDQLNQEIDSTYIKNISLNSNKVRFTKGNNNNTDLTIPFATNADTAQIAINDQLNQEIDSTYIKNVTTNGNSVVFNKGDDSVLNFIVPYALTSGSSAADVTWESIINKPTTYTPSNHTHQSSDISDFEVSVKSIKVDNSVNADTAELSYKIESKTVSGSLVNVIGDNLMMDFGEI